MEMLTEAYQERIKGTSLRRVFCDDVSREEKKRGATNRNKGGRELFNPSKI